MKRHEENILECTSMESTCNYLKTTIPNTVMADMNSIIEEALRIDLGNKLQTFETEYEVLLELTSTFNYDTVVTDFESVNNVLKKQNVALVEQLAICHGTIRILENAVTTLQEQLESQQERIERLERLGKVHRVFPKMV